MNSAIIVKPMKDGTWEARKSGTKMFGKGDSSVEAHCDLLERVAASQVKS